MSMLDTKQQWINPTWNVNSIGKKMINMSIIILGSIYAISLQDATLNIQA
jgi:hypothetical protein